MEKTTVRDAEKAALVKKTSRITGVHERSVYRVIAGDQENERVLAVYMELLENDRKFENQLLTAVNHLIPFN